MKTRTKKTKGKRCQDCGHVKSDVHEQECPFAKEIHEKVVLVTICNDCAHERAMNI